MLRIVIEDDRPQQPQPQSISGAASGGAVAPHLRQFVERRTSAQPAVFAPQAQAAASPRASAINAGAPPGWLHEAVKGLVSKAAETAIKSKP